jgi:1,4-alpha-glucan branching enzyme
MIKRTRSPHGIKVTFALPVDEVDQAVSVVGEFNDWDPLAHPLKKRSNGTRSVSVELDADHAYRFKYLTEDGSWLLDGDAEAVDNGASGVDSLITC